MSELSGAKGEMTQTEIGLLSGWALCEQMGAKYKNEAKSFVVEGWPNPWRVYWTSAKGKRAGQDYVHLKTSIPTYLREPDGRRTQLSQDTIIHFRGAAGDKVESYSQV